MSKAPHLAPVAKAKQSRFTREPLSEIRSSPGRYLVKPFVPRMGVGVIAGPSTSGKTFLALEMALRVSRGEPFNGCRVRQAGVLYISAEDPEGVRHRIEAWCARHCPPRPDGGGNFRSGAFELVPQAPDLRDGENLTDLFEVIREAAYEFDADGTPLGLIIFDTMSKSSPGADQNSSAEMGLVMSNLAKISAATSAMVMVVAHTPKDETRGIAGWYGQYAAADVVIMTSRDPDSPGLRTATLSKVKNGQDGKTLAFRLEEVPLGVDEDGDPNGSCVVVFETTDIAPRTVAERQPRLTPACTMALKAIQYVLDHGETTLAPPLPGVTGSTRAVPLAAAKEHALKSGFSSEGEMPNTVTKRWGRTVESLVAMGKVRKHEDTVWLV